MSTTNQNGARAKLLRALAAEGMLTVSELAEAAGLTDSQARDNANHAVKDGLVTKGRDDVTNNLAYKITSTGRAYLAERCRKAEQELSEAGPAQGKPPADTLEQLLLRDLAEASASSPGGVKPVIAPEDQGLREAGDTSGDDKASTDYVQAETPISVDAIDATEPAPPPEQYAICRAGQGHLSAWPLRDMTIEEARQLAIDDAAAIGCEVVLYRCVPIGKAFPRIVFEEA
ncbi:MAG TPA: MarR family transcriptional regulator [Azonexus sp.]|nr:MarR family transcriptional regulator [Azonexus sp.]